jgi:hypothetical protein
MTSSLGRLLSRTFSDHPIFIVGVGRSGTSVLKRALGAHPAMIACDGESPFVAKVASLVGSFETWEGREYQRDALRIPLDKLYDALRRLCLEAAMGPSFGLRRLMREVVETRRVPFAIHCWCAKTFPDQGEADCLLRLYPHARLIYIYRNGFEVVRSRTRFGRMSQRTFDDHCRAWAEGADRYAYLSELEAAITVRQEDLLAHPEETLGDIQRFIGIEPSPRPAAFARTTLVHPLDEPTRTTAGVAGELSRRQPAYSEWSVDERERFRMICGPAMQRLGYEIPF